jgi:hypothetical protein
VGAGWGLWSVGDLEVGRDLDAIPIQLYSGRAVKYCLLRTLLSMLRGPPRPGLLAQGPWRQMSLCPGSGHGSLILR